MQGNEFVVYSMYIIPISVFWCCLLIIRIMHQYWRIIAIHAKVPMEKSWLVHLFWTLRKTTTTNCFEHPLSFINSPNAFLVPSALQDHEIGTFSDLHVAPQTKIKQWWENSRAPSTREWWCPPLWPPTQCTCIPSSLCTQQSELGMQVHCIGGQRGGHHHSVVG